MLRRRLNNMHLEINGWDAGIKFSACHMIPGHETCSRLHGHIYSIHARIHGSQAEGGMIWDFHVVKDALRSIADDLDHKVLLPGNSEIMELNLEENVGVDFEGKHYSFPAVDIAVLDIKVASVEELSKFVLEMFLKKVEIPDNISKLEIGIDEGKGQGAWVEKNF
jgi:6-pyruvoyltetrahydropterin/6-carboxytetrahydropterin synthase